MGVMTQEVAATGLAPLIEKLNLAAAAGDQQLRVALINLEPELQEIGQAMRNSGMDTRFLTEMIDELKARAGSLPSVIQSSFDDISNITTNTFGDSTEVVRKAFAEIPAIAKLELPKAGEHVRTFGMFVGDVFGGVRQSAADTFGDMLTGAVGFKDGMLDIWRSLQRGIADILSAILDDFINRFLKGLLGSMRGQQGASSSAFSGLLPGLFGGGGAGLTNSAGVGSATWTAAAGMPGGAGAGAGAAATPWWSTALGGGAIGGAAGAAVGYYIGGQTGNTIGSAGAGGGTGAIVGAILGGPIGAGIGALIGGAVGWYGAMRERMRTNDSRDQFFSQFGPGGTGIGSGFHNVAADLTAAGHGEGGGQLFQDLITANDSEALEKAIAAVSKALDEYGVKANLAKDREKDLAAALEQTKAQYQDRIDVLQEEMKGLDDELAHWDATEAPEEVMGVIERQARDRIAAQKATVQAALDDQQRALEAALSAVTEDAETAAQAAGTAFTDGFHVAEDAALRFGDLLSEMGRQGRFDVVGRVRLMPEVGALGSMPDIPAIPDITAASGFHGWVDRPTHILAGEAGPERVDITPRGGSSAVASGVVNHYHTWQVLDGDSVRRVVNSSEFQDAFDGSLRRNERQFGARVSRRVNEYGVR
jgi:uncharacterized protein with PIN domain